MAGRIFLVGAGPGAPGLLTVHGQRVLSRAEVLVHDAPCDPALLALAPAQAERIPVGRWPDGARLGQAEINALLVDRARAGRRVVRLKGGDPLVFGRGGEEAQAAARAGIGFEIVPGVTAGLAAAALAGVPITQRGVSSEVVLALLQSGSPADWDVDLDRLASGRATLVLYLGPEALAPLAEELIRRGRPAATPVAVVESVSLAAERVTVGTLADIGGCAGGLRAPLVALVGEAVGLRAALAWKERRPLQGRALVLTGPGADELGAAELLEELGAEVLLFPGSQSAAPRSWEPLDRALDEIADFDWLVLSSAGGVESFLARLAERGKDARALVGLEIAAVGRATAQALRAASLLPDLVLAGSDAAEIGVGFAQLDLRGRSLLVVRGDCDQDPLPAELRRLGGAVRLVCALQTVCPALDTGPIVKAAGEGRLAAVVFACPRAVRDFVHQLGGDPALGLLAHTRIAAVGPEAVREVESLGLEVAIRPRESTASSLVEALAAALGAGAGSGQQLP